MQNNSVTKFLESLKSKDDITEIIINSPNNIYIERQGDLVQLNMNIKASDIIQFCKDIASFNKSSFNVNAPIIDGTLPDGSRINIISSLYTGSSPAITIRKYLKNVNQFKEGIFGLNEKWIDFIKVLVQAKSNILISGGTGRGKTTFLNLLLQEVAPTERIISIEDTKELSFKIPNTVRLFSKAHTFEITNPLNTRALLKNTLRMRPDRIIIGEVRGEEAFDLLQAMNTGHQGSMCTIHATDAPSSLTRLENLFMFAGHEVPIRAIRHQISNAIDFVIQLDKNLQGDRIISSITEVCNMEGDTILTQNIAKYEEKLEFTGVVPRCMSHLNKYGLENNFFIDF